MACSAALAAINLRREITDPIQTAKSCELAPMNCGIAVSQAIWGIVAFRWIANTLMKLSQSPVINDELIASRCE